MRDPQTVLPTEVIVCDDCSQDDTQSLVLRYHDLHPELSYVRHDHNRGTPSACNSAIRSTSCEIITRIDADDMREPQSFEKMLEAQVYNPHSLIYDSVRIFLNGKKQDHDWEMPEYDFNRLLEKNFIHAGIMFPRAGWEECGGYPEEFSHGRDDWSFNVALGRSGYCGVRVQYAGYLYRREKQNRTLRNSTGDWPEKFRDQMRAKFSDLYSGRFPMGCCGNRSSKVAGLSSQSPSAMRSSLVVGESGMTILEYLGGNYGNERYYGPVTGTAYKFSASSKFKNVDNRDLHTSKNTGLLDLHSGTKPLFRIYTPPVEETKSPEPEKVAEPEVVSVPEQSLMSSEVEEQVSMTPILVSQVKNITATVVRRLKDSGIDYWEQFLQTSSEDLARISGLSVDRIDEVKKEISDD